MRRLVSDTLIIAERNLVRLPRAPDLLLAFTVQPIMFVLLFRFVFGGAIRTPHLSYVDFLIPGIIVQNIAFGGFVTALGLNEDVHKGLSDRFRSLPMSRAAVLAGRTLSDILTNALSMVILIITGVIIGFSFNADVLHVIAGAGLLLLFGYAFSWVFAFVGLTVSSPEAANSAGFLAVFPLTFVSSAFVPVASMPAVLRAFADVNPFTITVNAMRALWLGRPAGRQRLGGAAVDRRDSQCSRRWRWRATGVPPEGEAAGALLGPLPPHRARGLCAPDAPCALRVLVLCVFPPSAAVRALRAALLLPLAGNGRGSREALALLGPDQLLIGEAVLVHLRLGLMELRLGPLALGLSLLALGLGLRDPGPLLGLLGLLGAGLGVVAMALHDPLTAIFQLSLAPLQLRLGRKPQRQDENDE